MRRHVLAATFAARLRGLIGRERSWDPDAVLVLAPCRSVHTFFMREDIDVAFVDAHGRVITAYRGVPPNRVLAAPGARMVLERFSRGAGRDYWPSPGERLALSLLP